MFRADDTKPGRKEVGFFARMVKTATISPAKEDCLKTVFIGRSSIGLCQPQSQSQAIFRENIE